MPRDITRHAIWVTALLVAVSWSSPGQTRGFGLGLIIGEPTGISGKYWVSRENAVDGAIAWSFRREGRFHIHADYLDHFPDAIHSTERFPLYIGIGARIAGGHGEGLLGIRFVGGIAFWPRKIPLDVFLELSPILDLIPATELSANIGLGVRYFFQ